MTQLDCLLGKHENLIKSLVLEGRRFEILPFTLPFVFYICDSIRRLTEADNETGGQGLGMAHSRY